MKITVSLTAQELENINISGTQLSQLVLQRIDSTIKNKQNIFHQVELEVELKVENVRSVVVQKKRL